MRGIIVGGIVLSLLMGCNNGGEDPQKVFLKSVVSLGNNFLDVFTSFGDMITESLGFKADAKKADVATYFKKVQGTLENTKTALKKIVDDMKAQENPNAAGVETAVKTLVDSKIEKIISGAKKVSDAIGEGANDEVGKVVKGSIISKPTGVGDIIDGIKEIVDIVLKTEGNHQAGTNNRAEDGTPRAKNTGAAHLFIKLDTSSDAKKAAGDASKAVGAVTGAAILQAMADKDGGAAKLAKSTNGNVAPAPKDATIAGGIALRAMAKGGKFANGNADGPAVKAEVKGASISAVTKALDTLTIAIRRTIDAGLKEVKKAMNINANDNPVTNETAAAAK